MTDWLSLNRTLEQAGVRFGPGLTAHEVEAIESCHTFRFPPDYRQWLQVALPISHHFVNWREEEPSQIEWRLNDPYEGIAFDTEWNNFWLRSWGPRPSNLAAALAFARAAMAQAPRLIPVFGHRYIPEHPAQPGNPIFSVSQTDIIYYGSNLTVYLENEFRPHLTGKHHHERSDSISWIPFWSYLVDINGGIADDEWV